MSEGIETQKHSAVDAMVEVGMDIMKILGRAEMVIGPEGGNSMGRLLSAALGAPLEGVDGQEVALSGLQRAFTAASLSASGAALSLASSVAPSLVANGAMSGGMVSKR